MTETVYKDARGLLLTTASPDAVALFDAAIDSYLGLKEGTGDILKAAMEADPDFTMAHVLRGYFMMLFGHRGLMARGRESWEKASELAEAQGIGARERGHVAALDAWSRNDTIAARAALWQVLEADPTDLLAVKLAENFSFYLGDRAGLARTAALAAPAWSDALPGWGFVRGMAAFAAEENFDFADAEAAADEALAANASDIWAAHAGAHVRQMTGRLGEAKDWIENLAPNWSDCGAFVYHLWWHRCLLSLETGDKEEVLEIYDRFVRPESTRDFRDIANASALLWRFGIAGIDVEARWEELADHAEARAGENVLSFAETHFMFALAGAGRFDRGAEAVAAARDYAASGKGESQEEVMASVGIPVCEAILAFAQGDYAKSTNLLTPIEQDLHRCGGSYLQQEVFRELLVASAARGGAQDVARNTLTALTDRRGDVPHYAFLATQIDA